MQYYIAIAASSTQRTLNNRPGELFSYLQEDLKLDVRLVVMQQDKSSDISKSETTWKALPVKENYFQVIFEIFIFPNYDQGIKYTFLDQ